jgi:hypothetical protein
MTPDQLHSANPKLSRSFSICSYSVIALGTAARSPSVARPLAPVLFRVWRSGDRWLTGAEDNNREISYSCNPPGSILDCCQASTPDKATSLDMQTPDETTDWTIFSQYRI